MLHSSYQLSDNLAEKVEFYMGFVPPADRISLSKAKFERLGYCRHPRQTHDIPKCFN